MLISASSSSGVTSRIERGWFSIVGAHRPDNGVEFFHGCCRICRKAAVCRLLGRRELRHSTQSASPRRMEQEFLSEAQGAFSLRRVMGLVPLRRDTGVLMNVFLGVILSVFKRSVACPGHGCLQHVYGVTISCSSWFYIKRNIVKSSFESRVDARKCCCWT